MGCPMQDFHAFDRQEVRTDTADLGPHLVQHLTQLLEVRLTGGIIDGGGAFGKDGSHHDIGSTRHRGLVEQHIVALQLLGGNLIDLTTFDAVEPGAQFLETEEVGVQSATPDLVTPGFGNDSPPHTGEQRTDHHHTATQFGTFLHKLIALQVGEIQTVCLEGVDTCITA